MTTDAVETLVPRLLDLWAAPVGDPAAALTRFAGLYTDPVTINGSPMPLTDLVARATALQQALDRTGVEILDVVAADDKVVVAFAMTARHIGTWSSVLGDVAATGRTITVRTIDVLTLTDGRVSAIWVVSDEAGLAAQLGASIRA